MLNATRITRAHLLSLVAASGCLLHGYPPPPLPGDAQVAVYRVAIEHASSLGASDPVLVFERSPSYQPVPAASVMRRHKDPTPPDLESSLVALTRARPRVEHAYFPVRVETVSRREGRRLAARGLGGTKVVAVTPVAFSPDSSAALVYVEVHCGPICGTGVELWLQRGDDGVWRIRQELTHWSG